MSPQCRRLYVRVTKDEETAAKLVCVEDFTVEVAEKLDSVEGFKNGKAPTPDCTRDLAATTAGVLDLLEELVELRIALVDDETGA